MTWTESHTTILNSAFESVLGAQVRGSIAFVRCLAPDMITALTRDGRFAPSGWVVRRVSDFEETSSRTITADQAVELREDKGLPTLLLIDTDKAGAGMDGIYSAALEISEEAILGEAKRQVRHLIRDIAHEWMEYADAAIKKARGYNHRFHLSLWTEFDFLVRIIANKLHPGELLYLIGLWPVAQLDHEANISTDLRDSLLFVDRLLGPAVAGWTPAQRIESLNLCNPEKESLNNLLSFLRTAATKPLQQALEDLSVKKNLWIHYLNITWNADTLQAIRLTPWRANTGRILKWSGLTEAANSSDPPEFVIKSDASQKREYSKFEVRWKTEPTILEKYTIAYNVSVVSDLEEELANQDIVHNGKEEQKCVFTNDDFSSLNENSVINAHAIVRVVDNEEIVPQRSEEFIIRYGDMETITKAKMGRKVRTFSEGLIELENWGKVTELLDKISSFSADPKGSVVLRTGQTDKSYRVFQPPLLRETGEDWRKHDGAIGRWRIQVRSSGDWASSVEFIPFEKPTNASELWERASISGKRMSDRFQSYSSVGQVYDEKSKSFDSVVKEYLLSWAALLEQDNTDPLLASANTVEVQSLSGKTIGLIVLPNHPLRMAWHVAYDNLVFHTAFEDKTKPKAIQEEFSALDGAMFPPFLPGLRSGETFVFADTLGFHAVGMTLDSDKEPKASLAILARAMGGDNLDEAAPTVGSKSAKILGNEIRKYIESHKFGNWLRIHALHPGDGFTVSRALGSLVENQNHPSETANEEETEENLMGFVLELYPSKEQRIVSGRHISMARERRHSGAGTIAPEDQWMLESISLPGGMNLPRLRWARKDQEPNTSAHIAIAFDTFESRTIVNMADDSSNTRPYYVHGLLSFFERNYSGAFSPRWHSHIPRSNAGEKHPSDRSHTDRLMRLHDAIQSCVAKSLKANSGVPMLESRISIEKSESLRNIHSLCDWVITLDRNAGIEYFDSPRENKEIYDAYVIDCVPEREDLGTLQLITSTSNLDEARFHLDGSLEKMGLTRSRRNAEFLMNHLKDLSGRFAIRMTGSKEPDLELIKLVLAYANCKTQSPGNGWVSLHSGILIPVDEIKEMLPPLNFSEGEDSQSYLMFVSCSPRRGMIFQFIKVAYAEDMQTARDINLVEGIENELRSLQKRWREWHSHDSIAMRNIRRAKLARILRFYADKARRHADDENKTGLSEDQYRNIRNEIDRMIEKGSKYEIADGGNDIGLGWIFCPKYQGKTPEKIFDSRIYLFGPSILPDWEGYAQERTNEQEAPPNKSLPTPPGNEMNSYQEIPEGETGISTSVGEAEPSIRLGKRLRDYMEIQWQITTKGNPHLLIAGLPGMGKTTCLLNICRQMLGKGIKPIVFSYHEDIDEKLQKLVSPVRFVDCHGLDFNPLQVINKESPTAYLDVAGSIRDIFMAIFPEIGDLQGEAIRDAIKESFTEQGWGNDKMDASQLSEPRFDRFLEILRTYPNPDKGLRTLLARLNELSDYGFFNISETHSSLWQSNEVIVIRIHATQNELLQKAFASLVFYGLYKDMFRRGIHDRITHAIIFDEAHRAAKLKLIPTMAKECRKYGISLVLASQEAKDFNDSLFSAIANYLVLRLNENDAKALVRNVSSSDQERELVNKIKQMNRFQALYFSEGRSRPAEIQLFDENNP